MPETYLDETDVLGLFSEALTADVETVLADKTSGVCADTADEKCECQLKVLL